MKIVAINTSPDSDGGNTSMILNPFIEGMKEAGATVELFNISEMKISPCRECTDDMFFSSDGNCKCKDDMSKLYPKFREADVWVIASPNYCSKIEPGLRIVLDRMEPLFQPSYPSSANNGNNHYAGKIAFVSTCEQYELDNFKLLVEHLKSAGILFSREYAGSLLRPHAGALNAFIRMGDAPNDVFEAAREAGRQLVKKGAISDATQKKVSRNLISKKSFIQKLNEIAERN